MKIEFDSNNILVYDSNPQGWFVSRVSVMAKNNGADRNVLNGISGFCFAVCTHDLDMVDNKIPVESIQNNLIKLCSFAFYNPDKTFYLPYFNSMYSGHSPSLIESIMPHLPNNIKRIRV
jgi:hypothetical protein